ncbi:MAG: hypothetical protein JWP98_503 [Edaphobacter sp.]|nr:hypothetical protein [Edaphobacter sp.]
MKKKAKRTNAFDLYADPLRSVLSCVTSEPLFRRRSEDVEEFFFVNSPVKIAGSGLLLAISQYFRVVDNKASGECVVKTESYVYEILDSVTHKDVFCFHWEPHSRVQYPHLHLGFATKGHGLPIDNKAHIPSGRVAVEDLVAFLISDLGVKPLKANWADILVVERQKFMNIKSW